MAAERWAWRPLVALPLVLLTGCATSPPAETSLTPLQAPKPVRPAVVPAPPLPATAGLTPLPSAQQVVTAVPLGRRDPFAPPVAAVVSAPVRLNLPTGFRFSGVILTGGEAQALVQLGSLSGSLRPGDRGGRTTDLLPNGWSVARIDVRRGVLSLRQGQRILSLEL